MELQDADGISYYLHGVIDRVDQDSDGRIRIVDYKSGSAPFSKRDMEQGLALQTALYAIAAHQLLPNHPSVAESYFLHIPSRKTSPKIAPSGPPDADETVRQAVEQAARFVRQIRAGYFPSLPGKSEYGSTACAKSCAFAPLCRVTRQSLTKARRNPGNQRVK